MFAIPNQMCIMDSEERIQNQTRGHKPKEKEEEKKMRISEALRNSGLKVTWSDDFMSKVEYNEKTFIVTLNQGYTDWTPRFSISIGKKTLATRCNYRTMVQKIKNYKD